MRLDRTSVTTWLKDGLLSLCLSGLALLAAASMVPTMPWPVVLAYTLCGAMVALLALVIAILVIQRIAAFVLDHGGTDTQWLWFPSEPRGLLAWRRGRRVGTQDVPPP